MIEVISEYIVNETSGGQFELVFGRGGAWSKIFSRLPGYRGTNLLRDVRNPMRYLVIDLWDSSTVWKNALAETESEHSKLLATISDWTASKTELGAFRVQAEGTIRPVEKHRRSRR
jgi:heme-degrading monooxygenase HmoA